MNDHNSTEVENTSSTLSIPSYCGSARGNNEEIQFWIQGVLLSVVGIIGVLGNMFTFFILAKNTSKYNIFNKILMQLVTGDSISICLMVADYSFRKSFNFLSLTDSTYGLMWPKLVYPFIKISYTWIMCCTIAITIER